MTLNRWKFVWLPLTFVAGPALALAAANVAWDEYKSGIVWQEPPKVTPGMPGENGLLSPPPSDALVLFDGQNMDAWEGGEAWEIKDGYAITRKRSINTKERFGDCQLHVEFATPDKVVGSGQGRGNSGIYLMGRYEVQVLDSWDNTTYFDGQCAALYKQSPPIVNACRGPGEWQEYDIIFKAPRFDEEGNVVSKATFTVLHNGILVQNNVELEGKTLWDAKPFYEKHAEKEPISLQFHGNETRFRNIWIRENVANMVGELPSEGNGEAAGRP